MPDAAPRRPRLIVTRPQPEASRWVQALQARGQDAAALPLIEIAPLPPTAACLPPGPHAALMFVSAAAVRAFFALCPVSALRAGMRFWCTGPGTAAALREAGVAARMIDSPPAASGQFDSEALWPLVRDQAAAGTRVCIVRGGDAQGRPAGREWLADTLTAAGAQADTAVVYRRLAPVADAAWHAAVRAAREARDVWLFSSSEAVGHLQANCPGMQWAGMPALATHARIAEAVRTAGFGPVQVVPPLLDAVVAALRPPGVAPPTRS